MEGPIQQLKICTSLNIQVMEDFKVMASTPLPESLKKIIEDVTTKLESILDRLPMPPSVPAGAPGGGVADKLKESQTDDMVIDTTAGPSGTKENDDKENDDETMVDTTEDQHQKNQEVTNNQENAHVSKGDSENEITTEQKSTEEGSILKETPKETSTPEETPKESPTKVQTPHSSPLKV
ncbi:hypothetical protein L2E82_44865 [Cichorium intybus]|uniref:Uncharacterized protein n=1 Tax=Cichorium intybus TaxID=13427 RepID=A0ACB8ZQJ1_CICIN|nr:hypothetical protein L2E82_44865 [Cichorium intybus]